MTHAVFPSGEGKSVLLETSEKVYITTVDNCKVDPTSHQSYLVQHPIASREKTRHPLEREKIDIIFAKPFSSSDHSTILL